jgi:hypothetical protein
VTVDESRGGSRACSTPAPRRSELADLRLTDLDLDLDVALVLGKGRRERALPYGARPPLHWTAIFASAPDCPVQAGHHH